MKEALAQQWCTKTEVLLRLFSDEANDTLDGDRAMTDLAIDGVVRLQVQV